ncbi:expressed unknown protein [Seminavis robusta]|uniref:CRAL-TRIO domain-containing protein n=1 Tax=Seminavis robusta TaxID=568900 RepID=A0A9N8ECW3_9STRA|nr:expressed unknown protein [Seminavis robusta]|eukprot:Sro989_g228501.1  (322) ;mRNA; f:27140-28105
MRAADSWLWLQDLDSPSEGIDHPIDPVGKRDKRPAVKDLIVDHRRELDELRAALLHEPLFKASKHDDLWLLRFLVSHKKKHSAALKAVKSTLEFRLEHKLDEFDIRHLNMNSNQDTQSIENVDTRTTHPYTESLKKLFNCCQHDFFLTYLPDNQRGIINMVQLKQRDQARMVKELTEEEYFQCHVMIAEWLFQHLDVITRSTGRLTKSLRLSDAAGMHLSMLEKKQKIRESKAAKRTEFVYPQLLSSVLIANAPTWASLVFAMVRPIVPKGLLEKVSLIKPHKHEKDLERILEHCSRDHLAVRYGGDLEEWPPRTLVAVSG